MSEKTFKTTLEQFNSMKKQSKNKGEFLYTFFVNETNSRVSYPHFLNSLFKWIKIVHKQEPSVGIDKINNYLERKFAQK